MRARGRLSNRRRKPPLSPACSAPSSAPISSTSVTLQHLKPESPASEGPVPSTALSSPESSQPI